ncbi:MAG: sigma-70 family RNA polymerase sigma factor [Planctomycetia bacterium]|nr:sigma-70 family RNA polymerase sigma factor [Planctomycetia bacterium]
MAHHPLARVLRHLRGLLGPNRTGEPSDGQLLERFVQRRDESAFALLMQRHGPLVLSVCRRVLHDPNDVDDAFQAVFVVLVRRAGAVDRNRSLASWLHGVAYRTALKARARAARLRSREQQAEAMPSIAAAEIDALAADPGGSLALHEMRVVLDDELNRLPEKYRAPLLLCYLEGKTNEQAAEDLGCPVGSMSWRLEKGRELLRQRLTQRGLALTSVLVTAGLNAEAATAAVPATLAHAALQSALLAAQPAGGLLPGAAAALAESVLHTMFVGRLRTLLFAVVAVSLLGAGAGAVAYTTLHQPTPPAPPRAVGQPLEFQAAEIEQRVLALQPSPDERKIDRIGWARDLRDALRLAATHNRPVFFFVHVGKIETGRCGGSAFNLRAFALADEEVITLLNESFVPVFANQDDYGKTGGAPPEEKAELARLCQAARAAKLPVGQDCVFLIAPDGQVRDVLIMKLAKPPKLLAERLRLFAAETKQAGGPPVAAPRPLSVPLTVSDDQLLLHLCTRSIGRPHWCEFPAEEWLVLSRPQWSKLLPVGELTHGQSYPINAELTEFLLRSFYPQTENYDAARSRIDRAELRGRLLERDGDLVRVRLDGTLTMKRTFYPGRDDDHLAEAVLTGFLDGDLKHGRVTRLRLVTEQASYGGYAFGAALRSVP